MLCQSGDVGFCPRPHLHLQVHARIAADSPRSKCGLPSNKTARISSDCGLIQVAPPPAGTCFGCRRRRHNPMGVRGGGACERLRASGGGVVRAGGAGSSPNLRRFCDTSVDARATSDVMTGRTRQPTVFARKPARLLQYSSTHECWRFPSTRCRLKSMYPMRKFLSSSSPSPAAVIVTVYTSIVGEWRQCVVGCQRQVWTWPLSSQLQASQPAGRLDHAA